MGKKDEIKTMAELAKRVGLSRYTVSKVLNGDPRVSDESRAKVLEACRRFDYSPNPHAVNLIRGKTNIIAMVVTHVTDPFYGEIIRAAETEANERGYQLVQQCSYQDHEKEARILLSLRNLNVCGIIITPVVTDLNSDLLARMQRSLPVVYVDRYLKSECSYVMNDNGDSAAKVTEHLISRGTRPAYLGSAHSKRNVAIRQRENGYLRTMRRHGLEPLLIPLLPAEEDVDNEAYGYVNMAAWISAGRECSAVFCANDSIALGAMKALFDAGHDVGKDVLVAGHDDSHFSAYTHPSLTTVRQPTERIGRTAVEMVSDYERGKISTDRFVRRRYASELIIRESA